MSAPEQTSTPAAAPATTSLQTITVPEGQRYIARVKWFDNTLSYGFATITSGEHAGRDIFVHQSNILTLATGIYRTLRMGEYIEFNLEESTDTNHKYQAIAVTGPGAGQLMCESNPRRPRGSVRTTNNSAPSNNNTQSGASESTGQQNQSRPNYRNGGRRGYQQPPIQVVVEYPNYQRPNRRPRTARPSGNSSAPAAPTSN